MYILKDYILSNYITFIVAFSLPKRPNRPSQ